ncbi:cytochrome c-type biogenesis protein CcmH [Primorskyibacter flagellatus]|uniref:Cytochrome c-type biogenesis protein n=1 Tax=Primorskyibacter flagellatus TaxID=1387277 RepID=A0A1W1ZAD6_9RHOB|nr:cytochrome c-type biogenesis protein [Primorskyibacter flagellatus]SMC45393.1 cytochrome c-type biogenesis protein CcmH [Primorskyibacter flagellatus]
MRRFREWWGKTPPYILVLCLALLAAPVWAVQPDEVLDDPALELRARELSKGLRCLVCQNESIDESNASLARDLRLLVRERLVEGDSDAEALAFIVDRYGEFVLLKPTTGGANWLLWAAGPLMLVAALGVGVVYIRRRSHARAPGEQGLNADESARLKEILDRNDP